MDRGPPEPGQEDCELGERRAGARHPRPPPLVTTGAPRPAAGRRGVRALRGHSQQRVQRRSEAARCGLRP